MKSNHYSTKAVVLLLLALLVGMTYRVGAQSPVQLTLGEADLDAFPTFTLPVTVANANGVPIMDLDSPDFEAFEDGKPLAVQSVNSQTNEDLSMAVALVLDLSGSAPLEDVKAAANVFLDSLGPNVRVALIGFNRPLDFTDFDPTKEIDFTTDHDAVRAVVEGLTSGGGSAVYEAVHKGVLITAEEVADRRAVIVMTDGYDTASRSEIAEADTPKAAAKEKGIPIFSIGVYNPDTTMGRNENYVSLLAQETGGRYQEAKDLAQLGELFQNVVEQLGTEYLLSFQTDIGQDGKDHTLKVRATTADGVGESERTIAYPAPPPIPRIIKIQREINDELVDISAGATLKDKVLIVPQISAQNPLVKVEYYVDGNLTYTALVDQAKDKARYEPWEWQWNVGSVEPRLHTLEVIAYDDADNVSERYPLEVETEGGSGINVWIIVAIVAAIILLGVALFLILRDSQPQPSAVGPATVPGPGPATDRMDTISEQQPSAMPPSAPPVSPSPEPEPSPPAHDPTSVMSRSGEGDAASSAPAQTVSLQREPQAMGWLIVQKGTSVGREFRLHEITTIGRRGDNDIVLDDATVSRSHAKIRLQDDTFVIADMGAANPTKVNGQEIGRQPLRDGDEVEIGKTQLVFKQIQSK